MASPAFRINGGAAGVKAAVSASATVTATLDSTDGVRSVTWSVIGTDETASVTDYTLTTSGSIGQSVSLTAGAAGTAGILRCEINGGLNPQTQQADPSTRATGKWYVLTTSGNEVGCTNETFESDAEHGYTGIANKGARFNGSVGASTSTTMTAGAGMTGGGTLAADRTFNVVANGDGSIVVNANDIQVGVISDAQHGSRGGGSTHAAASGSAAGFMSAAHYAKLDGLPASPVTAVTGTGAISSTGGTTPQISIAAASTSAPGTMSAADKTKLDGLPTSPIASLSVTAPIATTGGTTPTISIAAASGSVPGSMTAAHYTLVESIADHSAALDINTLQAELYVLCGNSKLSAATLDTAAVGSGDYQFRNTSIGLQWAELDDVKYAARRWRTVYPATAEYVAVDGDVITADGGTVTTGVTLPDPIDDAHIVLVNVVNAGVTIRPGVYSINGSSGNITQAVGHALYVSDGNGDWMVFTPGGGGGTGDIEGVTAGTGLTGGGTTGSVTLNVIAHADGSIVANANDVQVGVLASDAQHGNRGGGGIHANAVSGGAAGFMTGADKAKLDALPSATSTTVWVADSAVASSAYGNGLRYIPMRNAQSDTLTFQFVSAKTGTLEIAVRYAMTASEANGVRLRVDSLVVGTGSSPSASLTSGTAFTLTTTADVLLREFTSSDSGDLNFAVATGDVVIVKITRLGTDGADTHAGDMNIIEVRAT